MQAGPHVHRVDVSMEPWTAYLGQFWALEATAMVCIKLLHELGLRECRNARWGHAGIPGGGACRQRSSDNDEKTGEERLLCKIMCNAGDVRAGNSL